uniref:Uncharacterized protein n=1 Tax=Saccharopolyspora endophytica TaxID=543886 RepID=A0A0C5BHU7_9PSEU|nr:hypothetical protein pCM32.6c [Saccharopolyspora endophytica]
MHRLRVRNPHLEHLAAAGTLHPSDQVLGDLVTSNNRSQLDNRVLTVLRDDLDLTSRQPQHQRHRTRIRMRQPLHHAAS